MRDIARKGILEILDEMFIEPFRPDYVPSQNIDERKFEMKDIHLMQMGLKKYNNISKNAKWVARYPDDIRPKKVKVYSTIRENADGEKLRICEEDRPKIEDVLKFRIFLKGCNTGFEYKFYRNKCAWIAEAVPGHVYSAD